jgi:hypothetical protein
MAKNISKPIKRQILNLKELQQYFIDRVEATSGKHVRPLSSP